jgi:methionyl-tRNA formyltransferase
LPKYRGAAPVNWAIVRGEKTKGVTTMQMDAGLDTGDILLQHETEIGEQESSIELMERLSVIGADLLSETLKNFERLAHIPQAHEFATYAPILKKEDGWIDWNLTAREIKNQVRGFQPFPTSFTKLDGKKLTIWKTQSVELESQVTNQGEVVEAKGDNLIVSCGQKTFLQIDELQIEGKKRMKTKDFLNGIKIGAGVKFGK